MKVIMQLLYFSNNHQMPAANHTFLNFSEKVRPSQSFPIALSPIPCHLLAFIPKIPLIIILHTFTGAMDQFEPKRESLSQIQAYQSVDQQADCVLSSAYLKVGPVAGPTSQDQNDDLLLNFFYNKRPESFGPTEISFGKNFLAQHIKTLATTFQKHKESISLLTPTELSESPQSPRSITQPKLSKIDVKTFIKSARLPTCQMSHQSFLKKLKKQFDLEEFLKMIIQTYPRQLASELIAITIDTWDFIAELNLSQCEVRDCQRKAGRWVQLHARSYFERDEYRQLNGRKFAASNSKILEQLFQKFRKLLRVYLTTISLIMAGFFQNCYLDVDFSESEEDELDYPKRQISSVSLGCLSEEDSFSNEQNYTYSAKKVKGE